MNIHTAEILNNLEEELNFFLEARTIEEALYGVIVYWHNGLKILNEVISQLEDKN